MNLLSPKNFYLGSPIHQINKIENKRFLDELFKSDAPRDGKQGFFMWLNNTYDIMNSYTVQSLPLANTLSFILFKKDFSIAL